MHEERQLLNIGHDRGQTFILYDASSDVLDFLVVVLHLVERVPPDDEIVAEEVEDSAAGVADRDEVFRDKITCNNSWTIFDFFF